MNTMDETRSMLLSENNCSRVEPVIDTKSVAGRQ